MTTMFSHSDLLSHKCERCVKKLGSFGYPASTPLAGKHDELSQGGCLWYMLARACYEWIDVRTQVRPRFGLLERDVKFTMRHDIEPRQGEEFCTYFECLLKSPDSSTTITRLNGRGRFALMTGKTSSDATHDFIRAWIEKCRLDHSKCRSDSAMRGDKLSGIRFLRIDRHSIVLTEGVEPDRYACLSHCWGSGENLIKTTIQNRSDHVKMGVEVETLPQTYQDALKVCKELDIDYLWIDSLCIVQDDDGDWCDQASRMADVYRLSYVTIAAVSAENASQGLFNSTPECRIGSPLPKYPWTHFRQRLDLPGSYRSEVNWLKQAKDGKALYKRGWTFQELSLSPRVLHFGAQEVMWSCPEATVCEGEPGGNISLPERVTVNMSESGSSLQALWYRIVEGYSWRQLTFGKDKFPAIAAFANRIQAISPERKYVAGLWEDTLLSDLLWICPRNGPNLESRYPIVPGIIPSWSWASAKASVHWLGRGQITQQHMPCTEVIQINYNTQGPSILGDMVEASILLRAPVIKLYKIDCKGPKTLWKGIESVADHVTTLHSVYWDHDLYDTERTSIQNEPSEALAIPLVALGDGEIFGCNALIVTTKSPGVYRRAGAGTLGLLEESLDMGRKIQIEACEEAEKSPEHRRREYEEKQEQIRQKWKGRFVHEMNRLEREVIKLI